MAAMNLRWIGLGVAALAVAAAAIGGLAVPWIALAVGLYAVAFIATGRAATLAALLAPVPLAAVSFSFGAGIWWVLPAALGTLPFWLLAGGRIPWRGTWVLLAPLAAWLIAAVTYPETFLRSDLAPRAQVILIAVVSLAFLLAGRSVQRPRNV